MSYTVNSPFISAAPVSGQFAGVAIATLQQWQADAQQAIHDLSVGVKPSVVMFNGGEGQRSVTYTRTNLAQLRAYLGQLNEALGYGPARRPLQMGF